MTRLGNYELGQRIGNGAFGTVYKAKGTDKRTVAVKVLDSQFHQDPLTIQEFQREITFLGRTHHERIVEILDSGVEEGKDGMIMYYVMPWYPKTLRGLISEGIARCPTVPIGRIVEITSQTLEGLVEIHSRGAVHCDLRPENILLDSRGNVIIADFGMLRLINDSEMGRVESSQSGYISGVRKRVQQPEAGGYISHHKDRGLNDEQQRLQELKLRAITTPYSAPELRRDAIGNPGSINQRADLYSVGIILTELITGSNTTSERPSDIDKTFVYLDEIVLRACSRLERRFSSASEMLETIGRLREQYRTTTKEERAQRRRPITATITALAITGAFATMAIYGTTGYVGLQREKRIQQDLHEQTQQRTRLEQYRAEFNSIKKSCEDKEYERAHENIDQLIARLRDDKAQRDAQLLEEVLRFNDQTVEPGYSIIQDKRKLADYNRRFDNIRELVTQRNYEQAQSSLSSLISDMDGSDDQAIISRYNEMKRWGETNITARVNARDQAKKYEDRIDGIKRSVTNNQIETATSDMSNLLGELRDQSAPEIQTVYKSALQYYNGTIMPKYSELQRSKSQTERTRRAQNPIDDPYSITIVPGSPDPNYDPSYSADSRYPYQIPPSNHSNLPPPPSGNWDTPAERARAAGEEARLRAEADAVQARSEAYEIERQAIQEAFRAQGDAIQAQSEAYERQRQARQEAFR